MNVKLITGFIACLFLFTGCPYDGKEALCKYEESVKKDKKLFGEWSYFGEDGLMYKVTISKGDKWVMHVQSTEYDGDERIEIHYQRLFGKDMNGKTFYTLENKDASYNYGKITWVNDDEFVFNFMSGENVPDEIKGSVDALLKHIEVNIEKPEFYFPVHLYKKDSEIWKKKRKEWKAG